MRKLKNRFYIGHPRMIAEAVDGRGWTHHTLADAVEKAKELVVSKGEEQIVVQIVRVVGRKPQPIVVEVVK